MIPEAPLFLDSLEIESFRAFPSLQVPRLARVNLFVGKNNVGKTSLLEAVRVLADRGRAMSIFQVLRERGEFSEFRPRVGQEEEEYAWIAVNALLTLFNGQLGIDHEPSDTPSTRARIGRLGFGTESLSLSLGFYSERFDRERPSKRVKDPINVEAAAFLSDYVGLEVKGPEGQSLVIPAHRFFRGLRVGPNLESQANYAGYVPAQGLKLREIGAYWDRVALTPSEELVLDALRIISPDLERLTMVMGSEPLNQRTMMAKSQNQDRPVPLRHMGDGMNRILGIVLSLVGTQRGVLLVDEIENGIHYSVQPDLWRLIFRTAARLNVQVFATTHSWDCIEAFQEVASSEPEIEGMVHRLERRPDGTVGVVDIAEADLAIVARNQIEIR